MTRFGIYKNDSGYYTFTFDANDLFDFTREMDDWFGGDISCVKLIMPDDEVDVAFKNALSESPDDMKAMQVMEYVEELEMKNKKLKEENKELKAYKSGYVLLKERIDGLMETQERLTLEKNESEKENKTLKEKLEEADKYVVLQKIRNGEF